MFNPAHALPRQATLVIEPRCNDNDVCYQGIRAALQQQYVLDDVDTKKEVKCHIPAPLGNECGSSHHILERPMDGGELERRG